MPSKTVSREAVTSGPGLYCNLGIKSDRFRAQKRGRALERAVAFVGTSWSRPESFGDGTARSLAVWAQAARAARARSSLSGAARALHLGAGAQGASRGAEPGSAAPPRRCSRSRSGSARAASLPPARSDRPNPSRRPGPPRQLLAEAARAAARTGPTAAARLTPPRAAPGRLGAERGQRAWARRFDHPFLGGGVHRSEQRLRARRADPASAQLRGGGSVSAARLVGCAGGH